MTLICAAAFVVLFEQLILTTKRFETKSDKSFLALITHRRIREGGDIGLFITIVLKVFLIAFSCSLALQLWRLSLKFDSLVL